MELIMEILAIMEAKNEANQAEMKADRKAYHEEVMAMLDAQYERRMACLGKTEADTGKTEPDPGMMQSTEEHQDIPKGEAAVMPVGEPKKRRWVCNLAAERRQKMKKRTRGSRGSRRKSSAACRKVSCRAKVARRKMNLFMNVQTQRNCGPRKRVTVTGRKTTRRATVAWHSENVVKKDWTTASVVQVIQRERTIGRKPPRVSEDEKENNSHDWKLWETVTRSLGKP
jgi:hypothetical protein